MPSGDLLYLPCCSATLARSAAAWLGSDGVVVTGPALDRIFELDFFLVFEAVACTGVLASCDDAKGAVGAGSRLSLGMTGFVEVVFEPDFVLRAIL
jgi:hypothetical protein